MYALFLDGWYVGDYDSFTEVMREGQTMTESQFFQARIFPNDGRAGYAFYCGSYDGRRYRGEEW